MFKNVMIHFGPLDDNLFDPRKQITVNIDEHTFVFIFGSGKDLEILFGSGPDSSVFYRSFRSVLSGTTSNLEMLMVTQQIRHCIMSLGDDL